MEKGSATLVATVAIVVAVVAMRLVVHAGTAAADRARAQAAADAAALAGAVHGRAAADRAATYNDTTIIEFDRVDDIVTVTVSHRGVEATAQAAASLEYPWEREERAPNEG